MFNWKRSGPWVGSGPQRHSFRDISEDLPVDVMPACNEEFFFPLPPSKEQIGIMQLADVETERYRLFTASRSSCASAAATAIGFWAIDFVRQGKYGNYGWAHNIADDAPVRPRVGRAQGPRDAEEPARGVHLRRASHHVDPDGEWRGVEPGDPRVLQRGVAAGVVGDG